MEMNSWVSRSFALLFLASASVNAGTLAGTVNFSNFSACFGGDAVGTPSGCPYATCKDATLALAVIKSATEMRSVTNPMYWGRQALLTKIETREPNMKNHVKNSILSALVVLTASFTSQAALANGTYSCKAECGFTYVAKECLQCGAGTVESCLSYYTVPVAASDENLSTAFATLQQKCSAAADEHFQEWHVSEHFVLWQKAHDGNMTEISVSDDGMKTVCH